MPDSQEFGADPSKLSPEIEEDLPELLPQQSPDKSPEIAQNPET